MTVYCVDNAAFEDQLTEGQGYTVIEKGHNSYKIQNDAGKTRWYGQGKFEVLA